MGQTRLQRCWYNALLQSFMPRFLLSPSVQPATPQPLCNNVRALTRGQICIVCFHIAFRSEKLDSQEEKKTKQDLPSWKMHDFNTEIAILLFSSCRFGCHSRTEHTAVKCQRTCSLAQTSWFTTCWTTQLTTHNSVRTKIILLNVVCSFVFK